MKKIRLSTSMRLYVKHAAYIFPQEPLVKRVLATLILGICASACGGSSPSPTTPTTPPVVTRSINVSGDLAFGNVTLGTTADRTFTINNSGNATLTFTSLSAVGDTGAAAFTASLTSGTI